MAILSFEVEAKYDELIRLRQEVSALEQQMKSFGNARIDTSAIEKQYADASARLRQLTEEAARNGEAIKKAYASLGNVKTGLSSSSSVGKSVGNGLTEGITRADSASHVFKETLGGVNNTLGKMMGMLNGVGGAVGTAFGVGAIASFLGKVENVRTMFQDIESSMTVFLGSQEKAAEFTNELKDYAYYNMFEFSDLANASKQLIAYGNETKNIIPILDKLSNVASGTGASLGEMVALYNKAKSTGVVNSRDVQSWAAKGVVLRDELKAMGIEAAGSTITFNQLNDVLNRLTTGEGRFAGLMMEQMNNLSAARGQLQDNLDSMFNEIGEKLQPFLKGLIDAEGWLVDNYESVGKAILALAGTYGVYRTVLGVAHAAQVANMNSLKVSLGLEIEEDAKKKQSILSYREQTDEIRRQAEARLANARAARAEAEAELSSLREQLKKNDDRADWLRNEISANNRGIENINKSGNFGKKEYKNLDRLEKDNEKLEKELQGLQDSYDKISGDIDAKQEVVNRLKSEEVGIESALGKATNLTTKEKIKEAIANSTLVKSMQAMKAAAITAAPYIAATAAIVALGIGIYKLATAQSAEEQAQERVNDSLEKYKALEDVQKNSSESYISVIKDTTKSLWEQNDAYEKLISLYPELKKLSKSDIQGMSFDDVNSEVAKVQNNNRAEYVEGMIKDTENRIKDMYNAQVAVSSGTTGYTTYVGVSKEAVESSKAFKSAKEELKKWNEEYKKYKDMREEELIANLGHEAKKEIFTNEVEAAKEANVIVEEYTKAVDQLTTNTEMTKEERVNALLGSTKDIEGKVQENIDKLNEKIASSNISDEEKRTLQVKLTAQQKLLDRLKSMKEGLQNWLNSSDPLVMSFTVSLDKKARGRKALGSEASSAYKKYLDFLDEMEGSDLNDEEKAARIVSKINDTLTKLTNIQAGIGDTTNSKYINIENLRNELVTARDSGASVAANGISDSMLRDLSTETAQELADANKKLQDEQKNYGNYTEKLQVARDEYYSALNKVNEFEKKINSGEEYNTKEYKDAQETLKTNKSNYEALLKTSTKYNGMAKALREKNLKDERDAVDQSFSTRESEIALMKDGYDKQIEELKLSFDKKQEQIKRGYEDLKTTRMKEEEKLWKSNPNNVGEFSETAFLSNFKYTEEDMKNFNAKNAENVMSYIRGMENLSKSYETERQKKDEERRKVEEDILSIEQTISELTSDKLQAEIDGNDKLKEANEEALENLRERLKLAKQIAAQKGFDADQNNFYKQYGNAEERKQAIRDDYELQIAVAKARGDSEYVVRDLMMKMSEEIGKVDSDELKKKLNWVQALDGVDTAARKFSAEALQAAEEFTQTEEFAAKSAEEQKDYYDLLEQLREKVGYSLKKVKTDKELNGLKEAMDRARVIYDDVNDENSNATPEERKKAESNYNKAVNDYVSSTEYSKKAVMQFGDAISKITSGNLQDFIQGLGELGISWVNKRTEDGKQVGNAASTAISGLTDPVTGAILSIVDNITGGMITDILQKNLFEPIREMFKFITTSKEERQYDKLMEKMDGFIDAMERATSFLDEDFEDAFGKNAIDVYGKIQKNLDAERDSYINAAQKSLRIKSKDYGGQYTKGQIEWMNLSKAQQKALKESGVGSISDLFTLSADQLKELMSQYPSIFENLSEETMTFLDNILDIEKRSEEYSERFDEKMSGISKKDYLANFKSSLMDLDATAEEVASNMSRYFFEAMMNAELQQFDEPLERLYDSYRQGAISRDDFRSQYEDLVSEAIKIRDDVADMTGYGEDYYKQEASSRGFAAMNQETGSELNGRFTALQIAGEDIRNATNAYLPTLNASVVELLNKQSMEYVSVLQTQDILAKSLVSLQSIDTNVLWMKDKMEKKEGIFADIAQTAENTRSLR